MPIVQNIYIYILIFHRTVLFEMMTGHWPYSQLPVESIIWMVGTGKKPPIDEIRVPIELKVRF